MNRRGLLFTGVVLFAACQPVSPDPEKLVLDLGDLEDYAEWYAYDREEEPEPQPFEADPLVVTALGTVRAVPDIAVITATVAAEDANESRAVDTVATTLNAVQTALRGRDVETGFTALTSSPDYDEACLNRNAAARQRQRQILNDYWFNRRLDERGDTETRRRPDRPRLSEIVCQAEDIRVSTRMVVRVRPADAAGDVLRALSDAGAESAELFGYDFSDYDALYQQAAGRAVTNARRKAEAVAAGARGELGEIVEMSVSAPARIGRFGPQPTVIRPPRPRSGDGETALESYRETLGERSLSPPPPPPAAAPAYDGFEDEIIVTASRLVSSKTSPTPVTVASIQQEASSERVRLPDGRTVERVVPAVTRMQSNSNALTMSLMSGPQVIEVAARISYSYPTPLDGIIIKDPED